jgi:hypothetical protein
VITEGSQRQYAMINSLSHIIPVLVWDELSSYNDYIFTEMKDRMPTVCDIPRVVSDVVFGWILSNLNRCIDCINLPPSKAMAF